jgi:hypothetical protein
MKHTVEMASDGMIYTPSFMKTGPDVQLISRLSLRQLERL